MSQRFEGKNVEEALTSAAEAFGVERFQLTYHVLLEKRGFLGGVKRVVIEADINTSADAPVAEAKPAESPRTTESRPMRSEARGDRGDRGGRGRGGRGGRREGAGGGQGGQAGQGGGRGGRGRGGRGNRDRDDRPAPKRREATAIVEAPPQDAESEHATLVRAWCDEVIRLGHFDLEIRTAENEEQINVTFYGGDIDLLTDRHGELLDAFQVLANKALTGRKLEKDIEMDCEQFKARRVEDLEQRARETADRVRRDRREQLMPAMSPIERRIVHLALQDDREVTTESRGDGFFKRVAIILRPEPVEGQQPQPTSSES